MHQIKIFKGVESDLTSLEMQVNRWLASSKAKVVRMFGNLAPQSQAHAAAVAATGFSPSDVLLVILYEE